MSKFALIVMLSLSFLTGNYLYQIFADVPDFMTAFERSYFMAIAIIAAVLFK